MKQSEQIRRDDAVRALLLAAWLIAYLLTH